MNASRAANGTGAYTGGIPLNVTLHAWPVPKLQPDHKQFNQTNSINVRNSESAKNLTNRLHNLNATGYVAIDEDLTDTGFTDVQTLILAGIATLIPLFVGVAIILGIRFLWRRYRQRKGEGYEGVLQREESSEPLRKLEDGNLPLELKGSESQFSAGLGGEMTDSSSPQVPNPKSNGSVITMTLKNNHLIVETEETNDTLNGIKIESKGTTTKFVTPTVPEFRIELTEGRHNQEELVGAESTCPGDDGALAHGLLKEDEDVDRVSCNTGLSQSDLSVSSTESQNPSYRYGNQTGYDSGGYGYHEYSGYATSIDRKLDGYTKGPREGKSYSKTPYVLDRSDSIVVAAPPGDQQPDILRSDMAARESRLKENYDDERCQNKKALGNGDVSTDNTEEKDDKGCEQDSQEVSKPFERAKSEHIAEDGLGCYLQIAVNSNSGNGIDS